MIEWVTIKIFLNHIEAEIARSFLDSCGIRARVFSDDVPQLRTIKGLKLQVNRDRADEAIKILAAQVSEAVI